jgi:hypothetical protein
MTHEEVLDRLVALVGTRAGLDSRDAAQEAVLRALEDDRTLESEALLRAASEHLAEFLRRKRWARRRGRSVPLESAGQSFPPVRPVRRKQGWKGRYPKGTTVTHAFDSGRRVIPTGVGDPASPELQFAAAHLALVDLPRLATGEPYSVRAMELVYELFCELYQVPPRFLWAYVLLREIEQAKQQTLQDGDPNRNAPAPTTSEATLKPTHPGPAQEEHLQVPLEVEIAPTMPGRAVRRLFRRLDGKRVSVGVEPMTSEPETIYPPEPGERARCILNVVRVALTQLAVPQQLPQYADNPTLVAWLFARMGFEGGGGPDKVKNSTLLAWLCDPDELARQVEQYALRRAEHGTEFEAELLESGLAHLIAEIRAHKQV